MALRPALVNKAKLKSPRGFMLFTPGAYSLAILANHSGSTQEESRLKVPFTEAFFSDHYTLED